MQVIYTTYYDSTRSWIYRASEGVYVLSYTVRNLEYCTVRYSTVHRRTVD